VARRYSTAELRAALHLLEKQGRVRQVEGQWFAVDIPAAAAEGDARPPARPPARKDRASDRPRHGGAAPHPAPAEPAVGVRTAVEEVPVTVPPNNPEPRSAAKRYLVPPMRPRKGDKPAPAPRDGTKGAPWVDERTRVPARKPSKAPDRDGATVLLG
jgi:hypothetical protein